MNFNGVANQIDDHLPQPVRISDHDFRNIAGNFEQKFDAFLMRLESQCPQHGFQAFAQIEIDRFQVHLARFDLGEIEDVVNDREQGVRRHFYGVEVFALLRIQIGIEDQVGHPEDAVQRSANLMAHVRQEFALGPAGGV